MEEKPKKLDEILPDLSYVEEIERKLSERVYEEIALRGHHLLSLAAKLSVGEEDVLIRKMRSGEIRKVRITDRPDTVCEVCPRYSEACEPREGNDYDRIAAEEFGLELGKTYPAKEVLEILESEQYKKGDLMKVLEEEFRKLMDSLNKT
jgi:hypothetical protein